MSEPETLVTPEMERDRGVWHPGTTSYPITESDIRRWAIATYWPHTPPRLFWDADYANGTRFGGIVAPEDFNPFAWPVPGVDTPEIPLTIPANPGKGQNLLNGGQRDVFGVRMRPGDVVTSRSRLVDWKERNGRNGLTLFMYRETEWRNQKDEIIKTRTSTLVRY